MTPTGIRIDGTIDGQIDLLDRQIVTSDGRLLAKVDDIELERDGSQLIVTGFLVGPGALAPRLGGTIAYFAVNTWSRLARRRADEPRRVDYVHVTAIDTVIAVDEDRRTAQIDGLEAWLRVRVIDALPGNGGDPDSVLADQQPSQLENGPRPRDDRHRFSRLAGMRVRFADGRDGDQVTDVRLERGPARGHLPSLTVGALIVGRNRPGTLFGYDRNRQQGPVLVQLVLRRVHRHTGFVRWTDVASIDWDDRVVQLRCQELGSIDDL